MSDTVEKLIDGLKHWSHNYSLNNPLQSVGIFNETIAALRSLLADLKALHEHDDWQTQRAIKAEARAGKAEAENERLRGSCAYEKERGAALLAAVARAGKAEDEHRIAMDLLRQLTDDVTALTQQVETLEAKNARWKQLIQLRLMALGDPAKPSSDSEPPGTSSPSLSNPRSPDGKW